METGRCVGSAGIPHSSQADRSSGKIFFLAMTLARFTRPLVGCSGPFAAHPVSSALRSPLSLARFGLAIAMSCLPLSPSPCFLPTPLAAVARQRMNRAKSLLASFQQTKPSGRRARCRFPASSAMASLIFLASWTIFTRAHGRCLLPEAQARGWDAATLTQDPIGQQKPAHLASTCQ